MNQCLICKRETFDSSEVDFETDPFAWMKEMSLDCGGDCSGCVAVAEDKAAYAHCAFHNRNCVVWKHYEGSTHLCDPTRCIEEQDITTLMLNDAYKRWDAGEKNDFFDRITAAAKKAEEEFGDDA